MQSKGLETQAQKKLTKPFDHVTEGTCGKSLQLVERYAFALSQTECTAARNNPACHPSTLSAYAGSDSGEISSTRPCSIRKTRWQRRANDKLCVAIKEVS